MRVSCSVIIPSHNCLSFLPATLRTVTLQNRDDLEVIVVDDASTDGTGEWLALARHEGYRLKSIRTDGVGPSAARNRALAEAQGAFIAFLDADDQWWPGKLDAQLQFHAAHPETGLSFADYIHVTPDGLSLGTCFQFWNCPWLKRATGRYAPLSEAEANLLGTNVVGTSSVVVARRALDRAGGFDPTFKSAGDWDLWLRIAATSEVAFSAAVTMSYMMRPGSVSSNRARRVAATRRIVARYEDRDEPSLRRAVRIAKARACVVEAEAALIDRKPMTALAQHMRALAVIPSLRLGRDIAADVAAGTVSALRPRTA